ncbi:contact-dependent growth inhibition system immunity protein [Stenotrophomonas panacihumi]|uniref:contact-dependent growth inhibition system immunity protein n=1 Tax=Stenotrophomonas panacihumi TaxID=676599 RepID=UPI0009D769F7|nr:contact-dependent growth inhibition system immunity protein [Stenotrophomonas panacihumi]PTN56123.1 DUF1436 domain-containing protein [Stenotrophomonas panacihumi]
MPRASAYCNCDFMIIETQSGYRGTKADPACPSIFLPTSAPDSDIGASVFEALSRSRQISVEEIPEFFDFERSKREYEEWVSDLMLRYDYKTKRALFKDMRNVSVELNPEHTLLTLSPSHHNRLDSWIRTEGDGIEDVVVPADSSPAEVGAALRVAFSRCM